MLQDLDIRLFYADSHPLIYHGLLSVFSEHKPIRIVASSMEGNHALENMIKTDFDVALIDFDMPGVDGFGIMKRLLKEKPESKIIFFTDKAEEAYVLRMVEQGAYGAIKKNSHPSMISSVITSAFFGNKQFSGLVANRLVSSKERFRNHELFSGQSSEEKNQEGLSKLSHREFNIYRLIGSGSQSVEVAKTLYISQKTVSAHISNIKKKLGLRSREDIIRYAIKNNLGD